MNLHYSISGSGETLVFIHGAYVNSEIWQYQQAYFKRNYQVLTLDMRGHGKSAATELEEYSVETFGEDLIQLLDKLGIERVTICGLSLGAMVAQYVAAKHPERVSALVLVGATASLRLSILERFITTFIFPKWFAMWLFGRLTTRQFMKLSFLLTWFMRGNKWLGGPSTREKIRKSIGNVQRGELKKIYAAIHSFRKQNLHSGDYPVLLLNGEFDSPVIHWHSRYIKRKVGSRGIMEKLDGAGHACNFDQPLAFNQLMHNWLTSIKPDPIFKPTPVERELVASIEPIPALHHAS